MFNFNDHGVMMAVHEAHHREALEAAYRHNLVQRIKNHRPSFLDRLIGFRSALKIDLGANLAQECVLNPGVC